jgi:O-antigen/teichoic acid export membrane protein
LLGLFVALALMTLVPGGVLLGQLRFRIAAAALVSGALLRLGLGAYLSHEGFGLDGALVASVASMGLTLAVLLWPLRHEVWNQGGDVLAIHFRSATLAVAALGGFAALVGIDSVLARHYLDGAASGEYVAAATGARIALFLPSAIALIAFPKFAASRGEGEEAHHVLITSLLAVTVLGVVAAGAMILAPHLLISVLFGPKYQQGADSLRVLAVPAAGLGLVSVLVYFHLARHSLQALLCWLGVVWAVVAISLWHASPLEIAWSMFVVTGVTFAGLGLGAIVHRTQRSGSSPHSSPTQTAPGDLAIGFPTSLLVDDEA